MLNKFDLAPGMLSEFARGDYVAKYAKKMGHFGQMITQDSPGNLRRVAIKGKFPDFMQEKSILTGMPKSPIRDHELFTKSRKRVADAIKAHRKGKSWQPEFDKDGNLAPLRRADGFN